MGQNVFDAHVDKLLDTYGSEMYLGRLVWYSVSESLHVTHDQFYKTFLKNFADINYQPEYPKIPEPGEVFTRACNKAQIRNVKDSSDTRKNYLVRPTGHSSQKVHKSIVVEHVDESGHRLKYVDVVDIIFDRETEKITSVISNTDPSVLDDTNIDLVLDKIQAIYDDNRQHISPFAAREYIRRYIETTLQGLRVRKSGGIYFVSEDKVKAIEAIDKSLEELGTSDAFFHYLPLIDTDKQRFMVRQAFEEESVGGVEDLIGEITEATKSGKKITSKRFGRYKNEYDVLKHKLTEYRDILEDNLDKSTHHMKLLQQVLLDLAQNHVEV